MTYVSYVIFIQDNETEDLNQNEYQLALFKFKSNKEISYYRFDPNWTDDIEIEFGCLDGEGTRVNSGKVFEGWSTYEVDFEAVNSFTETLFQLYKNQIKDYDSAEFKIINYSGDDEELKQILEDYYTS
jgi:hypothetical protein